jgi:hypothetical protein
LLLLYTLWKVFSSTGKTEFNPFNCVALVLRQ